MSEKAPIKLVVINSWGPMGSSTLAALIERWGYSNIPIRKIGLTDYLLGNRQLKDPLIRQRFRSAFYGAAQRTRRGGLGRAARESASEGPLIDFSLMQHALEELDRTQFSRIADLYDAYRALFARGVLYKSVDWRSGCHIEFTVDSARFAGSSFARCYEKHFDHVIFLHMTRDVEEWLESFSSQFMGLSKGFSGFRLDQAIREYDQYMEQIHRLPGHLVDLKDLMIPSFFDTEERLSKIIGPSQSRGRAEDEIYDVYGRVVPFRVAFSLQDMAGSYLSWFSRKIIKVLLRKRFSGKLRSMLFHPVYLLEALRFRRRTVNKVRRRKAS